jgi:hypothetical protein
MNSSRILSYSGEFSAGIEQQVRTPVIPLDGVHFLHLSSTRADPGRGSVGAGPVAVP